MIETSVDANVKKDLVIFIPVHKNYIYLSHMLKSIKSEKYNVKYYLINNGSDYDTDRYCKILNRREGYTVEHHKKALGVARVWNRCLDIAIEKGYEYILITNSDILYHENCIDLLGSYLDANPEELITFPIDIKKVREVMEQFPYLSEESFNKFKYDKEQVEKFQKIVDSIGIQTHSPIPIEDIVDYSSFMVRPKELVDLVGYFDENFLPAYWEDTDMHWRLAEHGVKSRALLNAPMLHISSRSLIEGGFKNESYNPNAFYFIKKHDTSFPMDQIIRDGNGNFLTVRTFRATYPYEISKRPTPKVFDCFIFENDLDLLELHLETMAEAVDTFVIVESPLDLEGRPKPLYLKENLARFSKFAPKLKRLIIQNFNGADTKEKRREIMLRSLFKGLGAASSQDNILISELGEILDPRRLLEFKRLAGTKLFTLNTLTEKVNLLTPDEPVEGPRCCTFEALDQNHNNDIASLRNAAGFKIQNGGWRLIRDKDRDLLALVKSQEVKVIPLDHKVAKHFRTLAHSDWAWDISKYKHKGLSFTDAWVEIENEHN